MMMKKENDNPKRNKAGYIDMTAYKAIRNIEREEKKAHGCSKFSKTIKEARLHD